MYRICINCLRIFIIDNDEFFYTTELKKKRTLPFYKWCAFDILIPETYLAWNILKGIALSFLPAVRICMILIQRLVLQYALLLSILHILHITYMHISVPHLEWDQLISDKKVSSKNGTRMMILYTLDFSSDICLDMKYPLILQEFLLSNVLVKDEYVKLINQ